ncbi:hypothetical protein [Streptomyces sp. NPDC057877]|uniref:hypothetical protein n=1 Tax=Streptomyces sp. NPDC057877 TaxID=3346269 RepID=UPI0036885E3E
MDRRLQRHRPPPRPQRRLRHRRGRRPAHPGLADDIDDRGIDILARRRRRFVPRGEFAAMSRAAPDISLDAFRADQDAAAEQETDDPYAR